ncbi:response regulator [Dyadobacter bucti]|uniref:response regulator n=1 Tax=Dyadobacter bucti TaxID=2572203 RepID=UPI003F71D212
MMQKIKENGEILPEGTVVFLAEDDPEDVLLFQMAIGRLKNAYELMVFKNGEELLSAMADPTRVRPDIIFLDINMPVRNGMEALNFIRREISKNLPIFLLSTADDGVTVENGRRAGATGYLAKPRTDQGFVGLLGAVFSVDWSNRSADDFYVHLNLR